MSMKALLCLSLSIFLCIGEQGKAQSNVERNRDTYLPLSLIDSSSHSIAQKSTDSLEVSHQSQHDKEFLKNAFIFGATLGTPSWGFNFIAGGYYGRWGVKADVGGLIGAGYQANLMYLAEVCGFLSNSPLFIQRPGLPTSLPF